MNINFHEFLRLCYERKLPSWWDWIEREVNQSNNILLHPKLINELMNKPVKIELLIDTNSQKPNAKVKKKSSLSYELVISRKLLEYLLNVSLGTPIFFEFKVLKNKKIISRELVIKFTNCLFFHWITIIIYHEFAHIFRNHFNFIEGNLISELELNSYINDTKSKFFEKAKYLEMEADRYSGNFTAGIFHLTLKRVKKELKVNDDLPLIEDVLVQSTFIFFLALCLLFNEFSSTHPPCLGRTVCYLASFLEAKHKNPNVLASMSENQLYTLFKKHLFKFTLQVRKLGLYSKDKLLPVFGKLSRCLIISLLS